MITNDLLLHSVLFLHFAIVIFNVGSVPLIWCGGILDWQWVKNSWFRNLHLGLIAFVIVETLLGQLCPLTVLENQLRVERGDSTYAGGFLERLVRAVMYYDFEPWVFVAAYLLFGAVVVALYVVYPPRRSLFWRK